VTEANAFDKEKAKSFTERMLSDIAGTVVTHFCAIGDRLGLFKDLALQGPASVAEFATRNTIDQRYAQEWLEGLASAGYLDFDSSTCVFSLPAEHERLLAQDTHPMYQGAMCNLLTYSLEPMEKITEAFKTGGGVSQADYSPELFKTMQRTSALRYNNFLLDTWLPDMPRVVEKLESGVDVADIGCGRGTALSILAEAFPKSRFWGYDAFAPQVSGAQDAADSKGLSNHITFEVLDASSEIPRDFDLIFTFDVIHDMAKPREGLANIRRHLKSDGIYILQEISAEDERYDNRGVEATIKYGMSLSYCMTTSLAHGGEGLGTLGMSERVVRELCSEAGFGTVKKLPCSNDFTSLFEITAGQ
jgi:2-polyprenyl-3-methyl-5-hydroxy-6-metoxy-1,4-benzoquinol methylase